MLIKKLNQRKNKAVAPVIATLLMIAVAVAMSVIIFMWSQGFLAGTSESTGSQQGSQNQAAQSSISIETVTGTATVRYNATANVTRLVILARNVGAIGINVGSVTITGLSSNFRFTGSLIGTVSSDSTLAIVSNDGLASWSGSATGDGFLTVSKGGGIIMTLVGYDLDASPSQSRLGSGDVLTVKITTDKGTFAQSSYTVP